jgi:hypothetical protein
MNKWVVLMLAVLVAPLAQAESNAGKAAKARAAFDLMDRQDFMDGLEEADACLKRQDFGCADLALSRIQEFIDSPEQERLWQNASSELAETRRQVAMQRAAEQQRLADEQRRLAQEKKQSGFQAGKFAALATGAALGGMGKLDAQTQADLLMGMAKDSMGGQDGMGNTQQAMSQAAQRYASSPSSAFAGAVNPNAQVGADWTPEPNILNGSAACAGYTVQNHRAHFGANAGGQDTQLHTLCGAAYEYYGMYLNAKKQGYTKQAAHSTYEAFLGAARTAEAHYAGSRSTGGLIPGTAAVPQGVPDNRPSGDPQTEFRRRRTTNEGTASPQ